jgi:hypothetical protein
LFNFTKNGVVRAEKLRAKVRTYSTPKDFNAELMLNKKKRVVLTCKMTKLKERRLVTKINQERLPIAQPTQTK